MSYYARSDRGVVTFSALASSLASAPLTFQLELFWKEGTLTKGSMRLVVLDSGRSKWQGAVIGMQSSQQPLVVPDISTAALVSAVFCAWCMQ